MEGDNIGVNIGSRPHVSEAIMVLRLRGAECVRLGDHSTLNSVIRTGFDELMMISYYLQNKLYQARTLLSSVPPIK